MSEQEEFDLLVRFALFLSATWSEKNEDDVEAARRVVRAFLEEEENKEDEA